MVKSRKKYTIKNKRGKRKYVKKIDKTNKEYEIKEIIGKRMRKGVLEYKVHWKGYKKKSSTWEPVTNLHKALRAIRNFEKKTDKKKKNIPIIPKRKYTRRKDKNIKNKNEENKINIINDDEEKNLIKCLKKNKNSGMTVINKFLTDYVFRLIQINNRFVQQMIKGQINEISNELKDLGKIK